MDVSKIFKWPKIKISDATTIAILMAMSYVLSRIGIHTPTMVFTFGFVATAVLGAMYGPLLAGLIAGITDLIITFTTGTMYIPGFTLSAILGAFIYGMFLYKNEKFSLVRVIISQLVIAVLVNTLLNTLWLTIFLHFDWKLIIASRIIKQIVGTPIQIVILIFILGNPVMQRLIHDKWK
ncbi:folate family ECF transporter S component [Apilactobacillus bombintestini]|uniref:Folate family ECF transporter S component n=1 Tax=Apilactobacillus bombintestini TaxID=2419772 RepID=A0A387ATM0_9LACO|nr:folate family ECF transporter S component [Apilactobacillus bombintestini]AYF92661.1 folate family ECF transporter S component [Apilactobacillus bombintestini]